MTLINRLSIALYLLALPAYLSANKVYQTLHVNRGSMTTVKGTTFPFLAFNSSTFTYQNATVYCVKGDTLILSIHNNDSITHGFRIKGVPAQSYTITPTATITCTLTPSVQSIYVFYDHLYYPRNTYMGLAGVIAVKGKKSDKVYVWNVKEHQY